MMESLVFRLLREVPDVLENLLDEMEDVVFFAKDLEGRYCLVNRTLVQRVGHSSKSDLIGRRTDEVFPAPFGEVFRVQDEQVIQSGRPIRDRLELHFYPSRSTGWCRTFKIPWLEESQVVGLMGFSKDLHRPASDQTPGGVARALDFMGNHLNRQIRVAELAEIAGMAPRTFERAIQNLFRTSAGNLIIQARINRACRLLRASSLPISHVAQECGYSEHSSFSRQFRLRVGLTPKGFRELKAILSSPA